MLPVHPNPSISNTVRSLLQRFSSVKLIEPLRYRDFVNVMARSALILTDSGGTQQEASSLKIPVLALREATKRPEGFDAGATRRIGTSKENVVCNVLNLLDNALNYDHLATAPNPHGDGTASKRILDILLSKFDNQQWSR